METSASNSGKIQRLNSGISKAILCCYISYNRDHELFFFVIFLELWEEYVAFELIMHFSNVHLASLKPNTMIAASLMNLYSWNCKIGCSFYPVLFCSNFWNISLSLFKFRTSNSDTEDQILFCLLSAKVALDTSTQFYFTLLEFLKNC